jgi:predicted permease
VRRGRFLNDRDNAAGPYVAAVNEAFVRAYLPDVNPIGQKIQVWGKKAPFREIIGVIGDTRQHSLKMKIQPAVFVPPGQVDDALHRFTASVFPTSLILRVRGNPADYAAVMNRAVRTAEPTLPLYDVRTMDEVLGRSMGQEQFQAVLLGSFALLAVILAAVGIYGVMSYAVAQRTRELGVRTALGARPADVLRMMVGQGFRLIVAGILLGLAGAFALAKLLAGLLFGVQPYDVISFVGAPLLLALVALIAILLPARRAAQADPLTALRWGA